MILAQNAQIRKLVPNSPKINLKRKKINFLKALQNSFLKRYKRAQYLNVIKSYFVFCNFGPKCPNKETRSQSPKFDFFQKKIEIIKEYQIILPTSPYLISQYQLIKSYEVFSIFFNSGHTVRRFSFRSLLPEGRVGATSIPGFHHLPSLYPILPSAWLGGSEYQFLKSLV